MKGNLEAKRIERSLCVSFVYTFLFAFLTHTNTRMDARVGLQGTPSAVNPLWGVSFSHGDCYGFFNAFQKCYVMADVPEQECQSFKDDYAECKLHRKEARWWLLLEC